MGFKESAAAFAMKLTFSLETEIATLLLILEMIGVLKILFGKFSHGKRL